MYEVCLKSSADARAREMDDVRRTEFLPRCNAFHVLDLGEKTACERASVAIEVLNSMMRSRDPPSHDSRHVMLQKKHRTYVYIYFSRIPSISDRASKEFRLERFGVPDFIYDIKVHRCCSKLRRH